MNYSLTEIVTKIDIFLENNSLNNIELEFLKNSFNHLFSTGGKRLRPALFIWFAQMNKAFKEDYLDLAVLCEVFHTWTLVHDDIIDNDDVRRNQPTTHKMLEAFANQNYETNKAIQFGSSMATLTGDLQQAWVYDLVASSQFAVDYPTKALKIIQRISNWLTPKLINGEAADIEFEYRTPETFSEVEEMMINKTSILLQFCAETGIFLSEDVTSYDDPRVKSAGQFAVKCGLTFQLRDDILGIFGNFEKFGKPLGTDIISNKKTLLMMDFLENCNIQTDRDFMSSLIGKNELNEFELAEAKNCFIRSGSYKRITQKAENLIKQAKNHLQKFQNGEIVSTLNTIADYMIKREK